MRIVLYILLSVSFFACKTSPKSNDLVEVAEENNQLELIQKEVAINDVEGRKLHWVQTIYNNGKIITPKKNAAYIVFNSDGKLEIHSICNLGSGAYKLSGNKIDLEASMTTKRACDQPRVEYRFFEDLRSSYEIYRTGNKVFFKLNDNSGKMEFELAEE